MTREEAINFGEMFLEVNKDSKNSGTYEFIKKALKLLKQEPCEDCISRQAVLSKIKEVYFSEEWLQFRLDNGSNGQRNFLINYIEQLPPVTPKGVTITDFADKCRECGKQKKGKWICVHHLENKITYYSWKCSECQHDFSSEEESKVDFDEYKYCPNCGAKMKGKSEEV